jgi:hypothetical protein
MTLGMTNPVRAADIHKGLLQASKEGRIETVREMLGAGANVNVRDEHNRTPRIKAVVSGHYEIAKLLLDAGADVNAGDASGMTPIMMAAQSRNVPMAKALVKAGADANAQTPEGHSVLEFAMVPANADMIETLINAGADPNRRDDLGRTALMSSIVREFSVTFEITRWEKYKKTMLKLIEMGAKVNLRDRFGHTAIFYLSYPDPSNLAYQGMTRGLRPEFQFFIDTLKTRFGADKTLKSPYNLPNLDEAYRRGDYDRVKEYLDAEVVYKFCGPCNFDTKSIRGMTSKSLSRDAVLDLLKAYKKRGFPHSMSFNGQGCNIHLYQMHYDAIRSAFLFFRWEGERPLVREIRENIGRQSQNGIFLME